MHWSLDLKKKLSKGFRTLNCLHLPLDSGQPCYRLVHPLRTLCYENFLFRVPCFPRLGTYRSTVDCCCTGKIHIYCLRLQKAYRKGEENHCHPGREAAAVRLAEVFFSSSECSSLRISENSLLTFWLFTVETVLWKTVSLNIWAENLKINVFFYITIQMM